MSAGLRCLFFPPTPRYLGTMESAQNELEAHRRALRYMASLLAKVGEEILRIALPATLEQ
jgi:hypothetical protein